MEREDTLIHRHTYPHSLTTPSVSKDENEHVRNGLNLFQDFFSILSTVYVFFFCNKRICR